MASVDLKCRVNMILLIAIKKIMELWGKLHKICHIIYIIFLVIPCGHMLHCGDNGLSIIATKKDLFNSRYLAKTTTWSQFLLITYIIKIKRANPVKMDLP